MLARQQLAAFGEEARAGGPPTDAEVQAITDARFWELDRPRMVQVVHAVVLSAEEDPEARALAERIGSATSQVNGAKAFLAAARAVEAGRFKVQAESLAPVAPDGRAVDPPGEGTSRRTASVSPSRAASRAAAPPIVSITSRAARSGERLYLVKVIDARQPSLDERRALLHDEIMSQRATALAAALLEQQRRELQPSQSRSAIASMQQFFEVRRPSQPGPGAR